MAIYLGPRLLGASSDLTRPVFPPPGDGGKFEWALLAPLCGERGLFGLAPGGVYLAARSLGAPVSSYLAFSPLSRLSPCTPCGAGLSSGRSLFCGTFLIPHKAGSAAASRRTVRVTDHPALWSSDFPLLLMARRTGPQKERPSLPRQLPPFLCPFAASLRIPRERPGRRFSSRESYFEFRSPSQKRIRLQWGHRTRALFFWTSMNS